MANDLKSLEGIFNKRVFRIPDYQRGYAWLNRQLVDFWSDLILLQKDRDHYAGLLSIRKLNKKNKMYWQDDEWLKDDGFNIYHIVDGQQRITTAVILINEIIEFLKNMPNNLGKDEKIIYLVGTTSIESIKSRYICRIKPSGMTTSYLFGYDADNPSAEYLRYKVFEEPYPKDISESYYTRNLSNAKDFFKENLESLFKSDGIDAIISLYQKLTKHFKFNLLEINDNYNVYMAFETMNNRGKKLTNLELLKNRLIYITTLYDDKILPKSDKEALRKTINETWKEVYIQLGRNKVSLSDDEFLRAHWIIYYKYSRNRGDDYIKFLLNKFSTERIFGKVQSPIEDIPEKVSDEDNMDDNDSDSSEFESAESIQTSLLKPNEISEYANSLKEMSKYWYDTFFPKESDNLSNNEKTIIDRLNRIGIGYFRPLVAAIISRRDANNESRVKAFEAIERFIFICFRMGGNNSSFRSGDYYKAAREIYHKEINVDYISNVINEKATIQSEFSTQNFVIKIEKLFSEGKGYYGWKFLKYFLYEYELHLANESNIDKIGDWSLFIKEENDKVSIEHILPQTPNDYYWRNEFRQFNPEEINKLTGALGNLLPLSQSINSSLQNETFENKKHTRTNGRRGYDDGSHSEIEVSKIADWTATEIYKRSNKLLEFMQKRWNFEFTKDQIERLIGLSFINDGREIPPELKKEDILPREKSVRTIRSSAENRKLFWLAFINYAKDKGRTNSIAKQKASSRASYDVHIGPSDYQIMFSIPYGNIIRMSIYVLNQKAYSRLYRKKQQIETKFGDTLNWDFSDSKKQYRLITIEKEANVFKKEEQPIMFDWFLDHFDRITSALIAAGERINSIYDK